LNFKKTSSWKSAKFENGWANSRMVRLQDGAHVYEIGKLFAPASDSQGYSSIKPALQEQKVEVPHFHEGDVMVVGLTLSGYEAARKSDLRHAFVMAGIVLVVGTGALFFIFIIQNYYLVDRTLKQTREYAERIVESMSEGLVSIDLEGRVVSCNLQSQMLLGIEQEKIEGASLESIIDLHEAALKRSIESCTAFPEKEITYLGPDGNSIPLGVSVSPIISDNDVCSGSVLLIRDLREIKRLEERIRRSEKLAATGKLAAGIAHEIRNPLSSVRGFAQFLHHALADRPKDQEYAAIMVTEMDRINRVVSDLLSFASPKEAEPEPTDIGEIVSHVIRLVESEADGRNIELEKHVDPDLDHVELDGYQITQMLLNLLLNALKFVDTGGQVSISAARDDSAKHLVLTIEDNGVGITEKNMTLMFDPFFTTRETGTGLGLAIVHNIVENHQGEIDVESPPFGKDKGSRFIIRIPMNTT
jgi:two-component system sensor histidine kinase HydH